MPVAYWFRSGTASPVLLGTANATLRACTACVCRLSRFLGESDSTLRKPDYQQASHNFGDASRKLGES